MIFDHTPVQVWKDGQVWLEVSATDLAPALAKADNPNERWITLHPHGDDSKGVPVKIKMGGDGTAHVLSGPGELRGLRLTRLATPEQLKERQIERDQRRAEKAKQDAAEAKAKEQSDLERSAHDPNYAQQLAQEKVAKQQNEQLRQQRVEEITRKMQELHGQLLDHAATITGDGAYQSERAEAAADPAKYKSYKQQLKGEAGQAMQGERETGDLTDAEKAEIDAAKGAGAVIASRNVRQVSSSLKALRRDLIGKLVKDPELRSSVLGEDAELDPDVGKGEGRGGGVGYKRDIKGQAATQGYTAQDARNESAEVFAQRVEKLREAGEEQRADALIALRQATMSRAAAERALKSDDPADDGSTLNTPAPTKAATGEQVKQHADQVRGFLEMHSQLEALEREKRALLLGKDPDANKDEQDALELYDQPSAGGAETGIDVNTVPDDFAAKLDAEIKDAAKADVTRAFLDDLSEGGEGQADKLIRERMQAHVGAGAYAHFGNVALAALGHEGLDRQVVDALGIDAAAQLLVYAIQRDLGDTAQLRAGLAQAHDETSVPRMVQAMELARAARADAAEIELPKLGSATDAGVLRDLQKRRKAAIGRAHEALGTALGAVEAGAALNLALKGSSPSALKVRFDEGAATGSAAMQLRALGLTDEDYQLSRDPQSNTLSAKINEQGMAKLAPAPDGQRRALDAELRAIKSGALDEADYLPAGFMARKKSDLNPAPSIPAAFQQEAQWGGGPQQAAEGVAASMTADGFKPSEILRHLLDTVAQECPDGQQAAFAQAVTDLIPFATTEQRTAQDGTTYAAHVARDVDHDPEIKARLGELSKGWLDQHHAGEAGFHSQSVPDDDQTREALFRAIASEPALQAAFSPPADLGGTPEGRQRVRGIKNYFFAHTMKDRLGGKSPADFDERARAAQQAALEKLGPAPEKWGGDTGGMFDMFGGGGESSVTLSLSPHATPEQHAAALSAYGLSPEHYELKEGKAALTEAGKAKLSIPATVPTIDGTPNSPEIVSGGLDSLNPQWVQHQRGVNKAKAQHPTTADLWQDFTDHMRGPKNAYAAVQETMQDDLLHRFVGHHAALTGQQLRVSKQTTRHWERRLAATDPDEAERVRSRDRNIMEQVRGRDGSGRYLNMGEGGLISAVQDHIEKQSRQANLMGNLFGLDTGKAGGEVTGKRPQDLDIGAHERLSLGNAAEGQLARMLNTSRWGLKASDGPASLKENLTWGAGTKHVTKQRLVRMLLKSGRVVGWLGAGSGKTGTMLGAFTQAHEEGKARKSLYVVPSIVRNQFGEAAAEFTQPGKYSWHAEDASYEERKKHYSGDTHMVVVTHQTFRDDMLKLLAEHHGIPAGQVSEWFGGMSRAERARVFGEAMQGHRIPLDMIHVDEAHDFLDRQGKQDSTMSKVLSAALDNAKYKGLWTGSPVKNDVSEVHSWLSKVDPERFADRNEFMRRYGVNTKASSEALQRLVDSYSVIDSVRPDVQRKIIWGHERGGQQGAIPLTPQQEVAMREVQAAFGKASAAQSRGEVDIDSAKILSPRSFQGQPQEDHRRIAARLQSALGTLKHSAVGRVVNEFAPEHNAKVQHVLNLAGERRGKGGVIFARNRASIAMLKEQLEAQGHKVGVIDGSTSTDGKGKVRNQFDEGAVDIVLCSDAGATGANLQHRGKWLVNYDLPMTQKTLEQRNARIDRLGQDGEIELHHLITDTAYDRDNQERLTRKAELGGILQGEYRDMDDTGLAAYIRRADAERAGDTWDTAPRIDENAKPEERGPDVPDDLGEATPNVAQEPQNGAVKA